MKLSMDDITDLFVQEELKDYGYDQDGTPVHLPVHFVVAELHDGTRYAHNRTFEQEPTKAEALCQRISRADEIDLFLWDQIDSCYGSEAYQRLDNIGFFADREKKEDIFNY